MHFALYICFGCYLSQHPCRCFLGAVTPGIYLNRTLNAFVRWAHTSLPAPPRLGGYPSLDAWCLVWLLLGGVCGRVVCLGYMCLAICSIFGAAFSVMWTCFMIYIVFWCGFMLFGILELLTFVCGLYTSS